MTIQRELFEKEETQEDQTKDFLKGIFAVCEQTFSAKTLREAFSEWEIEKDIEREMERDAIGEQDVGDF